MLPKVSIVIPFYNCPYVDQAIQSAVNQTYPNVEVVVVSDGSTQHLGRVKPYMDRIKFIEKPNGGTASAVNRGIVEATGDYFAWLSSDDRFYPHKVEHQLSYMMTHGARACFTNYDRIDEKNQIFAHSASMLFRNITEFYTTFMSGDPINGCTVMTDRSLIMELGYFNQGLALTHDYDMWYRIILNGVDFHFLNETLTLHRTHSRMREITRAGEVLHESAMIHGAYNARMAAYLHHLHQIGVY
ncbi:glycosyltransferase family 2 protein [Paenibacillus contaminans]|uniref:Glycosyl transferase n=1 Tax=Paenibacillus contaminans TaxID=450362 RepID=A0A329MTP4_9BACL|nr:glycosyltransferase [Paenibacillus contaminans]RAV22073.1 glycosyl transferase [Paenibacillus contaminans]